MFLTLGFAGAGWAIGYFVGGSHDWGWRCSTLAVLVVIAVACRVNTEVGALGVQALRDKPTDS